MNGPLGQVGRPALKHAEVASEAQQPFVLKVLKRHGAEMQQGRRPVIKHLAKVGPYLISEHI